MSGPAPQDWLTGREQREWERLSGAMRREFRRRPRRRYRLTLLDLLANGGLAALLVAGAAALGWSPW